jgi:hypothetical protein
MLFWDPFSILRSPSMGVPREYCPTERGLCGRENRLAERKRKIIGCFWIFFDFPVDKTRKVWYNVNVVKIGRKRTI